MYNASLSLSLHLFIVPLTIMLWSLALLVGGIYLFYELYWKRKDLPPGSIPLPLLGNSLSVTSEFPGYKTYQHWKDKYGPIYTYWLGTCPIVTFNDMKIIQDTFINDGDAYADRGDLMNISEIFRGGVYGIVDTSGEIWREQRRFTLHTLRDLGLGKQEMQEKILMETDLLLSKLEKEAAGNGGTISLLKFMDQTVASVINLVVFGYRFDEENLHEYVSLRELLDGISRQFTNPLMRICISFPKLTGWIPFVKKSFDALYDGRDALYAFLENNIKKHREVIDFDDGDYSDFCEAYLKEQYKQKEDPKSTFMDRQLSNVVLDLWTAGIDTTSMTMSWEVCLLLNHPETLVKLHKEYDEVIGTERLITIQDKPNLPYVNAFINETQRWANILPQNLLRKTTRDVEVEGFLLKKGTFVSPQISMLLADPEIFPDPFKFNPDRHIDENGKLILFKQLLPFSVGRRQCPGEGLARMELFLFFANLTNRFHISPIDPTNPPSMKRSFSEGGKPLPFKCRIMRRHL